MNTHLSNRILFCYLAPTLTAGEKKKEKKSDNNNKNTRWGLIKTIQFSWLNSGTIRETGLWDSLAFVMVLFKIGKHFELCNIFPSNNEPTWLQSSLTSVIFRSQGAALAWWLVLLTLRLQVWIQAVFEKDIWYKTNAIFYAITWCEDACRRNRWKEKHFPITKRVLGCNFTDNK